MLPLTAPQTTRRRLGAIVVQLTTHGPTVVTAAATTPGTPKRTEDVVYARKFGVALTLDVFQPAIPPNGVGIIAIVSGGWFSDHAVIHPRGANWKLLLSKGYTVFAVCHGCSASRTLTLDRHRASVSSSRRAGRHPC